MKMSTRFGCLAVIALLTVGEAFVLKQSVHTVIASPTALLARYDPYDNPSEGDLLARNQARTDVRNLLTQRTIQSFVYLLNQCRDEHTVRWFEKTLEFKKIDSFHGTGAFNTTLFPTWDSVFLELVSRPAETVVVSVKRRQRRHRGWGGGNSYLDNLGRNKPEKNKTPRKNPYLEEKTVEYEFDIDPASLVHRLIPVREQIAKEWESDLDTLIQTNDEILVSYADHQKELRALDEVDEDDEEDDEDDEEVDEDDEFVKDLTAAYADHKEDEQDSTKNNDVLIFDRNAMVMLTNSISSQGRDSSSFRRSNFDLLVLLCTQESIHRILSEYSRDESEAENYEWLKDFYAERVAKMFDGHQPVYGSADDFIEELLVAPPLAQKGKKGDIHLIDPMAMAEDIIHERSKVAREWKKVVGGTPEEHTDLRRLLLTRRMMESTEDIFSKISAKPAKTIISGAGAFE